jgi:hypothetical protein
MWIRAFSQAFGMLLVCMSTALELIEARDLHFFPAPACGQFSAAGHH